MEERRRQVVLVVEDDCLLRSDIVEALEASGWSVLEADSAEAAFAHIRSGIAVLLTDIDLRSTMSGWDVAQVFRLADPTLGVIYTSGIAREHERRVIDSLFFPKPYDPRDIIDGCRLLEMERSKVTPAGDDWRPGPQRREI